MTVQQNVLPFQQHGAAVAGPHPASLETLDLIEQALAQTLNALRAGASAATAQEAGRIEYESWFPGAH